LNNGYHTIHHFYPRLHWSLLVNEHKKQIRPHIHPNLDQPDMAVYAYRTFINPGLRLTYLKKPIVHTSEQKGADIDWISYPKGSKPLPSSLGEFLGDKATMLFNAGVSCCLKFLAPAYSPVFGDVDQSGVVLVIPLKV
jgi:hypothetical protein